MNRENFEKLATYLESLPKDYDRFDMRGYQVCNGTRSPRPAPINCGTVACAAAHGPSAGVAWRESDNSWGSYVDRAFTKGIRAEHSWVFAHYWAGIDNTHRGAAARIRYMLVKGVPGEYHDGFPNYVDQVVYAKMIAPYGKA